MRRVGQADAEPRGAGRRRRDPAGRRGVRLRKHDARGRGAGGPASRAKRQGVLMRFLVMVKASPESEAGIGPSTEELETMARFHEELAAAGATRSRQGP